MIGKIGAQCATILQYDAIRYGMIVTESITYVDKQPTNKQKLKENKLAMWANAQRDGRPAEYRWCPLFNAAKFGRRPLLECRAVTLPRRETC